MELEEESKQAEEICILLKRISNLFNRAREPSPGAPGAMGSGYMLTLLCEENEINQRDLVQRMRVRPASASEMLRKMEQEGLIQRRADQRDRRSVLVSLTAKGRYREVNARNQRREVSEKLLEALDSEERKLLRDILHKLFMAYVSREEAQSSETS